MSDTHTLDAEIAQRLFGWTYNAVLDAWETPDKLLWVGNAPAYTTDPAATAQVWQWLETRGAPMSRIIMDYVAGAPVQCVIQMGRYDVEGTGATWPDALCRAALALAERLEGEKP